MRDTGERERGREGEHHCHLRHEMFVLFRNRLLPIFDELKEVSERIREEAVEIGMRERGGRDKESQDLFLLRSCLQMFQPE